MVMQESDNFYLLTEFFLHKSELKFKAFSNLMHKNKTCRNDFFQTSAHNLTLCMNRPNIYLWCWKPARVKNFIQYICTASTVFNNFWPLVLWWIVLIFNIR